MALSKLRSYALGLALLLATLLPRPALSAAAPFDALFDSAHTLRVDVLRTGTHGVEELSLANLIREGPWAGPRTGLMDLAETGDHRVLVEPVEPSADAPGPIFAFPHGSLFSEWQTTAQAKTGLRRAFHETVRMPYPRHPVRLLFETRDRQGTFQRVTEIVIDPAHRHIRPPRHAHGSFPVLTIQEVGETHEALDVLILGEGYTERDMPKYRQDVARFARAFLEAPPLRERRDRINLRALEVVSRDRGTSEPRKGLLLDTALGTTFDTFESARYLTTVDNEAMRDIAGTAPYDTILIVVNTARYGGAGVYNLYGIFPSDNEFDEYVMLHEFGHSFGGLADEYYGSDVAYEDFYPQGVEPSEPNITALLDPERVKWSDLLSPDIPCPTPPDPERFGGAAVGCFEGAGYQAKGLYRPSLDCKMFGKGQTDFCAVCARAILNLIDHHAGR